MNEYLGDDFFKKMAFVPFGAVVILMVAQGITWGIGSILPNWPNYVGAFIFISVVLILSSFLLNKRIVGFFSSIKNHPFVFIIGLFLNLALLAANKPKFALSSHSFSQYLPYLIIVSIAWILFPFVVSEKFQNSRSIPQTLKLLIGLFSFGVTIITVLLMAMGDIIGIMLALIKI